MCLMCIEIAKNKITLNEVRRALPEMVNTAQTAEEKQHYADLQNSTDEQLKAKATDYQKKQPYR